MQGDCGYTLEPPRLYALNKNKDNIKKSPAQNFQFLHFKKNLYITWACFRNDKKFQESYEPCHRTIMC